LAICRGQGNRLGTLSRPWRGVFLLQRLHVMSRLGQKNPEEVQRPSFAHLSPLFACEGYPVNVTPQLRTDVEISCLFFFFSTLQVNGNGWALTLRSKQQSATSSHFRGSRMLKSFFLAANSISIVTWHRACISRPLGWWLFPHWQRCFRGRIGC